LLAENANLRAELAAMNGPKDPNFILAGADADVLYADNAVASTGGGGSGFLRFLGWCLVVGVVGVVVYLICFKNWSNL
jgi:hypothetical protein